MLSDFITPEQITILTQIILIDLVLAGDNAIIIGMVASKFPLEQRRKIIFSRNQEILPMTYTKTESFHSTGLL